VKDSVFSTFKRAFSILSVSQLQRTRIQFFYSFVQAFFELVSVAVLIPLIAQLSKPGLNSISLFNIHMATGGDHLLLLIIIIIAVFLLKNIVLMITASRQAHFVSAISTEISLLLFSRFYKQSWLNYVSSNTEDYIRKIKEIPSDFAHHVLHNLIRILTDILTGVILITFLSLTDFRTILVLLGMLLPVWIIYLIFKRTVIQNFNKSFRDITPVTSSVLAQSVESFMEAKLYGKEDFFLTKYSWLRRTSSDYLAKLKTASYFPSLLFEFAGVVIILGLLYYATQIGGGNAALQLIALVTIAVYKIFPVLNRVLNGVVQVMAYRYTIKELELSLAANKAEKSKRQIAFNNKIILDHISFTYPDKTNYFELKDIHLEINKGDFVVITGPSGSGKSTLLHVIAGLLEGYSGQIKIDEHVYLASTHSWNGQLSIVPQIPVLLQDTIRQNIAFGINEELIDDQLLTETAKDATIYEFIKNSSLEFNTLLGENGLTISGGQRQCIALARALYNKPRVLLLDEPTNQLDGASKINLLQSLKNLQAKGLTIVLISHDLVTLTYSNKHVEIKNGTVEKITLL
jgi:ABC-type bacteriocin/lantibiotic exporter with double-glycine peptidase domain